MTPVRWLWHFSVQQFWGGHPNTFRSFFAWASLSYAVFMVMNPAAFNSKGFTLMQAVGPMTMWASLFAFHWALLSIVLIPHVRDRLRISHTFDKWAQMVINCYGFFLWTAYVVLQDVSLGYPALNAGMERVALAYSAWAALRTGMGRRNDHQKRGA